LARYFELSRGGDGDNVRPMEGMRGFAVFLVFLVHYATLVDPWIAAAPGLQALAKALHTIGNTGVDLFFVLSGYLIYGSLLSRPSTMRRFMFRRIERIYPAFIAVFVLYVILSFIFPEQSKIPNGAAAGTIYLLKNFFLLPGLFPIEPMIAVAWSLSYEMFYYLAIPVLIDALALRRRSTAWRVCMFVVAVVATAAYCAVFEGHVRLLMFVSGILLWEATTSKTLSSPTSGTALAALVSGLLATLLPVSGAAGLTFKVLILFGAFFVLCFSCFEQPHSWLGRAFSWTPLRWLGNMSYSYYLLHGLALKAGFLVVAAMLPTGKHEVMVFVVLLPVMFAVTLVPCAMLFLAIERPFSLVSRQPVRIQGQGRSTRRDASESA